MALVEYDLMGNRVDKVATAIQRLRAFEPPEGYYLAFSGGKDSTVLKALADEAGVKYDAHYNATTVDPPELVRFIREYHPDVEIVKPDIPMRMLIVRKMTPPSRRVRYCCEHYKERKKEGRLVATGVRWAESSKRRISHGAATIIGKRVAQVAEEAGAEYKADKTGILLNFDDAPSRRVVEMCYRTANTTVNPIVDWSDEDVWEYIHTRGIPYCSLYDEGWQRLGCVSCPMGGGAHMKAELERWPAIRRVYERAFAEMIRAREEAGRPRMWSTVDEVMSWWVGDMATAQVDGQTSIFDEEELP